MEKLKSILFVWEEIIEHETIVQQDILNIVFSNTEEDELENLYNSEEFVNSKIDKHSIIGIYVIEEVLY